MKKKPLPEVPPVPGARRDPRREPRRGDLFKAADGSLLRIGSASVTVALDGIEIPCLAVESIGLQSKHTSELLTLRALRERVAEADVVHRGPSVDDPWRGAPRHPAAPVEPVAG
jgi:hypothetical protein